MRIIFLFLIPISTFAQTTGYRHVEPGDTLLAKYPGSTIHTWQEESLIDSNGHYMEYIMNDTCYLTRKNNKSVCPKK